VEYKSLRRVLQTVEGIDKSWEVQMGLTNFFITVISLKFSSKIMAVFWVVEPCSLVEFTNVSDDSSSYSPP
jgi:hypothetical protein